VYEGSSKSFHTDIFKENGKHGRSEGGGAEVIVGCHMTSWQGKPVDLLVSVCCCEVVSMSSGFDNFTKEE
jgi:hypothetical protein